MLVHQAGSLGFFQALKDFAGLGNHPEIANLPFVMYGSSNGGSTTYGFVNYAPERAICFVTNVSAGGRPEIPVDEALKVPGIFIVGKFDALMGREGSTGPGKSLRKPERKMRAGHGPWN